MKTIKLFFSTLLVVIISAIGMASCNDDDELKDKVIEVTMSVSENTDIMYWLFDHGVMGTGTLVHSLGSMNLSPMISTI